MTPSNIPKHESKLEREQRIFGEQFRRLGNVIVNKWFDLKPSSAGRRMMILIMFLILAGFVISLTPYPLSEWRNHLERAFLYLFTSNDKSIIAIIGIMFELITLGVRAFFNPYVFWYAPAFFLPIFIAFQGAAFYLADIFELDDIRVARKFLRQVSLTGSKDVIHISQGEIAPEDRDSPISKIGGPGKVIVDLDSVVLFEKVNGHPNVIGPTGKEPKGKATLEGFERFRQALDLRDQYIDLRDEDGKYAAVKGRSLDGIPVTATDVRLMFSVYRGRQKPVPEMPYPYAKEAIEQQVYKSTSQVTPNLTDPSKFVFIFENSILSMVRRELGKFMSEKNLTEYLASIHWPEVKRAEEQENMVLEEARLVLEPLESVESAKQGLTPPPFVPRREITDLFSQFTRKFTDDAQDKGVELHWIGVGTWNVPIELVLEKHLDAWKMSRENIYLNSKESMASVMDGSKTQKTLSMIQSVPLSRYQESIAHNITRDELIRILLQDYQSQLVDSFEFQHNNRKRIRPILPAAITYLYEFILPPHHGPIQRPLAVSQREEDLYSQLIIKIGIGSLTAYKIIERLIELQRESNSNASREELLEVIIQEWDKEIK